jgi:hypothetical protein
MQATILEELKKTTNISRRSVLYSGIFSIKSRLTGYLA